MRQDNFSYHYPLMMIIKTTYIYEIFQVIIIIFASSFFYAVFWRIFTNSCMDWDHSDIVDVYNGKITFYKDYFVEDNNFEDHYGLISSEEAYE